MRIELIETNRDIFNVAFAFRELAADVFESFGKSSRNTVIETFHDFGTLQIDSTKTAYYSFRNEEFFYWILLKGRHNLAEQENIEIEFESQIKNSNVPIFQAFAEYADCGKDVLSNELKPLKNVKIEFAENYKNESAKLLKNLREVL